MKTRSLEYQISLADMQKNQIAEGVWRILKLCDNEFLPPLSCRSTTTDSSLKGNSENESKAPQAYFEGLKFQSLLVATSENNVLGFMSFKTNYSVDSLKDFVPSNHITTVCVDPVHRGIGICSAFYKFILQALPEELKADCTSTRTWSTNQEHLSLLDKFGFTLTERLPDDRATGIDTVYYARRNSSLD